MILQASRLERWKGHAIHLAALGLLAGHPGLGVLARRRCAKVGRETVPERIAVGRGDERESQTGSGSWASGPMYLG